MRTKNAMQLKARISNMAKEAGIPAQAMMQSYLLERLLERLAESPWRDNVVIKGGVLISSLVGVGSRTTMDLDTTVRGFDLTHESAERVFREIAAVQADDDWEFEFDRTEDIRETDDYPGIRVYLKANYAPMSAPLTVDVTTGDRITPEAVEYNYLLYSDDDAYTRVAQRVVERGAGQMVPSIMEKTGLSHEDAHLIFVHNVQGNLAVNRLLGWKRGPKFAHAQELLGSYSEGGLQALSALCDSYDPSRTLEQK